MKKTYIDSGVLLDAARGNDDIARRSMGILDDPDREFASSVFVRLEVLPKARYHKNREEAEFYELFFRSVAHWADSLREIVELAQEEASKYGLNALDALHVAAALSVHADELVTSEKNTSSLHRARSIKILSTRLQPWIFFRRQTTMRTAFAFLFLSVLFLPALAAQVPCEPVDREKDILISSVVGKADFEEYFLKDRSEALNSLCSVIGIQRTPYAECDSSWHRVRIVACDVVRIYELLGVVPLLEQYGVPRSERVAELARINEMEPDDAVQRVGACLDELKRVVGI